MKKLKLPFDRSRLIVLGEIAFLIALAVLCGTVFLTNRVHPVTVDETSKIDGEIAWGIDEITSGQRQDQDYVTVTGWFVELHCDLEKHREKITVLLKDENTGVYYRVRTTMSKRTDITYRLYDGTEYTRCGFTARFRDDEVIRLDKRDYRLYVWAETASGKQLVDLETGINEWIEAHPSEE